MYCDLLEESVSELKDIPAQKAKNVFIDIKIDAFLPESYVPDPKQRIALYRRMNNIGTYDELEAMKKELDDRFGAIPPQTSSLLNIIKIKVKAGSRDIASITGSMSGVEIKNSLGKIKKLTVKEIGQDKLLEMIERSI
jgi:transcription-repair coupling factor (superfamily II helicase)